MTALDVFVAIMSLASVGLLTGIYSRLGGIRSDLGHHARRIIDHEERLRDIERSNNHVRLVKEAAR